MLEECIPGLQMVSRIYPGGLFYVLPLDSTCHGIVKNQNVCFSLRPFSLSEIAGRDEKTVVATCLPG